MSLTVWKIKAFAASCCRAGTAVFQLVDLHGNSLAGGGKGEEGGGGDRGGGEVWGGDRVCGEAGGGGGGGAGAGGPPVFRGGPKSPFSAGLCWHQPALVERLTLALHVLPIQRQ